MVSNRKSAAKLMVASLYVPCLSPLATFEILSLLMLRLQCVSMWASLSLSYLEFVEVVRYAD